MSQQLHIASVIALVALAGTVPVSALAAEPANLPALERAWHSCARDAYDTQQDRGSRASRERNALDERSRRAERAAAVNREVSSLASVWRGVADFLDGEVEASGHLLLGREDESKARRVEYRALTPVHEKWHAPTLILDATAPPADVLARALGIPVDLKASISAVWSPYGRVRQIVGAPVSATKLGLTEREGNRRAISDLRRLIVLRAALVFPRVVAVVAQKDAIAQLEAVGLPKNVEAGHSGALAGLDRWRQAARMIVIGRTMPLPGAMEIDVGVLVGGPGQATVTEDGRKAFFDRVEGGIRLRSGGAVAVERIGTPIQLPRLCAGRRARLT